MTTDLLTLTVDGDPADWLFWHTKTRGGQSTIRVDGSLPNVYDEDSFGYSMRPLRAEDRVMLATYCPACIDVGGPTPVECDDGTCGPFATATIAKVQPVSRIVARKKIIDQWLIIVTEVTPL